MALKHNKKSRFLFVGDQSTHPNSSDDPTVPGDSYVRLIRDYLRAKDPPTAPLVLSRSLDGAPLSELAGMWEKTVLSEHPDVLSIMIDVPNPSAESPGQQAHSGFGAFQSAYRQILTQTLDRLPECKLILCEPPATWSLSAAEADENLRPYVNALLRMGEEFDAEVIVPIHSGLIYARRTRPDLSWVDPQGRPNASGQMVIANTWLEENGLMEGKFG